MASLSDVLSSIGDDIEYSISEATTATVGDVIAPSQGKFSGQLRASNNVGLGQPDLKKVEVVNYVQDAISGTTILALANAKRVMEAFRLGETIFISNNHDYAIYDEYKHGRLAYEAGADSFKHKLGVAVASK